MALGIFLFGRGLKKAPKFFSFAKKLLFQERFLKCYSSDENKSGNCNNCKSFRHRYSEELEKAVNTQIHSEFNAGMAYLSMYCYFGRTNIALPGCQLFFKAMYEEEQGHALKLINYQIMRGGIVQLCPTTVPEDMNWTDVTVAFGVALEMEKRVKEKLEEIVALAECHKDLQLADFLTSEFLKEQNESICEIGRFLTRAKRLVDTGGVGRYLFDRDVYHYTEKKFPMLKLPFT